MSDVGTPTGYQDAVTPPRFSNFAIAVYLASFAGVVYGWWQFGWLFGLAVTVGFFIMVILNKLILLPRSDSEHFRKIVVHSMINRHANYLKSGDMLRASAMAELLEKLGIPVNEFVGRLRKSNDA